MAIPLAFAKPVLQEAGFYNQKKIKNSDKNSEELRFNYKRHNAKNGYKVCF